MNPAFDLADGSPVYAGTVLAGIVVGALSWMRHSRNDPRVAIIYLAALTGAFLGAKAAYLFSDRRENWRTANPQQTNR